MIKINIRNIEDLILKNPNTKTLLSDLRHHFDKWLLSYRFPALNAMRQEATLDLLNSLNASHIEKLAGLFNDMVFIDKLDNHITRNIILPTNSDIIEKELTEYESYINMALSRNADQIYISLWR